MFTLNKSHILCALILSVFLVFSHTAHSEDAPLPMLSIESDDIMLKEFIDQVSKKSGYRIVVSEELLDTTVSGSFSNINLEQLFHKIFRKHNVFQIIDTGKKELLIYTNLRDTKNVYASQPGNARENENLSIDVSQVEVRPGVTLGQMREERNELSQQINKDQNKIGGDGGPSLGETRVARDQLSSEIINNKRTVEIDKGRTLQDLKASQEDVSKKVQEGNIPLDDDSGLTNSDMQRMRTELERKIRSGELVIGKDDE